MTRNYAVQDESRGKITIAPDLLTRNVATNIQVNTHSADLQIDEMRISYYKAQNWNCTTSWPVRG